MAAAGATTFMPQQDAMGIGLRVVPGGAPKEDAISVSWVRATVGFFAAMGIPTREGRPFSEPGTGWDHIVMNESLARRPYPEGALVDRPITLRTFGGWTESRIEAVVGDVHLRNQRSSASNVVYTDLAASPSAHLSFAVRAAGDVAVLTKRVGDVAASIDRSVPPYNVVTTRDAAAGRIAGERAIALLARLFSAAAVLLSALGLYGLVAQALEGRRRELGIRLALGARPRRLVRRSLVGALRLVGVGLGIGLVASAVAAEPLSALLFEVPARDPAAFACVAVVVLAVAAVASWLPARRVARIDPIESLRAE